MHASRARSPEVMTASKKKKKSVVPIKLKSMERCRLLPLRFRGRHACRYSFFASFVCFVGSLTERPVAITLFSIGAPTLLPHSVHEPS